jgi:hypothetical protein
VSTDDEAYNQLVRTLTAISKRFDSDPADARATAMLAVRNYLSELGTPSEAMRPVQSALSTLNDAICVADYGNRPGPKPMPFREIDALGLAAAVVTGLKTCGWSVADAVERVSKEVKIDRRRLKTLRDNIHRGRANPLIVDAYYDFMNALPADGDEILACLRFWLRDYIC